MSLFEDIDTNQETDTIESEKLLNPDSYPFDIDDYRSRQKIEINNLICECHEECDPAHCSGKNVALSKLYNDSFGEGYSIFGFDLNKKAFAYSSEDEFKKESYEQVLDIDNKTIVYGQWIVSKEEACPVYLPGLEESFSSRVHKAPDDRDYHIYEYIKYNSWETPVLKFVGVYRLDKEKSITFGHVILERIDTQISIPIEVD